MTADPACRSRCGASWSEGDEDEEQGKGRDSSLLRVAPHSHTFSLSRSHHHLNQSVNDSEKFISLAPTLPPYPSLPFGAASPNRKNYLLCNRLSLHLRHLPKHPCPRRLVRRHHHNRLGLHYHRAICTNYMCVLSALPQEHILRMPIFKACEEAVMIVRGASGEER